MPIGSLRRQVAVGCALVLLIVGAAPVAAHGAGSQVRGPVPVLGVQGKQLVLRDAARLPDGSVIVAGARDGRAFATRVRASGVLEERFGRRGVWQSEVRGEATSVRIVGVGQGAAARKLANQRVALTLQRADRTPVTVWLGADGRGKRAPAGTGGTGTGPQAAGDAAPVATPCTDGAALTRDGWRIADAFEVRAGTCGALLAAGSKRVVVMQRSASVGTGPGLITRTVASGSASQVAARCLNHLLLFGVTRTGGRVQLVVQAVDMPSARKTGRSHARPAGDRAALRADARVPVCEARGV